MATSQKTLVSKEAKETVDILRHEILHLALLLRAMESANGEAIEMTQKELTAAHFALQGDLLFQATTVMESVQTYASRLVSPAPAAPTLATTPPSAPSAEAHAVLQAQAFELVDHSGRVRARLACDHDEPRLYFYTAAGVKRAALGIEDGGPCLYLCDKEGEIQFLLDLDAEMGWVSMRFDDHKGRPRLELNVDNKGPSLVAYGTDRKETWRAPIGEKEVA